MSLTIISNDFLATRSAELREDRNGVMTWEGMRPEELALLKRIHKQPRSRTEPLLISEGTTYVPLYLKLLKKLKKRDNIQTILVLIADALIDHEERVQLFMNAGEQDPDLPYAPLLDLLEKVDEFTQLKSTQVLTILLNSQSGKLQAQQLIPFLNALTAFIKSPAPNKRDVSVQALGTLLRRPEFRRAVWGNAELVSGLRDILKDKPGAQISYQVGFCFWLLSFDQDISENINKKYDIIPLLTDVAQIAVKEKVIRVIVMFFCNLVRKAPEQNLPAMLVAQLLPFVKTLCSRKWSDEDIIEDVQFLRDELKANFDSLTTYDEYSSELTSGHLSWTPVHESEAFWKENASKLNDKDYEQLKALVKLLKESSDPTVLAVASHDIGQYVKYCDLGKKVLTDLGAKTRVMELMNHIDADVRYQALISVQRLVSQPWVMA